MFNLGFGGQPGLPGMGQPGVANLGFGGQFGGGFIQAPGAADQSPVGTGDGSVVYAVNTYRANPKDRSGRKGPYQSDRLSFPVGPDGFEAVHRQKRY